MEIVVVRVAKGYEERRSELLRGAWGLFATRGYDATTVNAIIDELGIAKGTFYHYFSSKEELLDACVEEKTVAFVEQIKPLLETPELSALAKLNRFMDLSVGWKAANIDMVIEVIKVLYRGENMRLLQKMNHRTIALIAPLLTGIIEQGRTEKVFDVPHPGDAAEMLLHLSNVYREMNAGTFLDIREDPEAIATIQRRIDAYIEAVTRMLGAPSGSVDIEYSDFLDALVREDEKKAEKGENKHGVF